MRLIDADALLAHIKEIPTWWADEGGEYGHSRKYPEAMFYPEDIVSAIECADTIDIEPRWEDIVLNPPSLDDEVLLSFSDGTVVSGFLDRVDVWDDGSEIKHWCSYTDQAEYTDVCAIPTHWMPCPTGIKKGQKNSG